MIHNEAKIGKDTKIYFSTLCNIGKCEIGDNCVIHSHVWIGDSVVIGNDCKIQAFTFIPKGVQVGNNVFIGPGVVFTNDKYPPSDNWLETVIEDNVSIGAGVIILPGLTLRKGCKIGAGSVVTKDVSEGELVYGNPARRIE